MKSTLIHGDCLQEMKAIPDGSVDLILTDPPYGTTKMEWDSVIPLEPMWWQAQRIIKPSGAIVIMCAQPFTSILIASNVRMFKYSMIWRKSMVSNFAQAPYRPLSEHEDIAVFSDGGVSKNARLQMVYNPQGLKDCNKRCKGKGHSAHRPSKVVQKDYVQTKTGYPKSIVEISSDNAKLHPTQKPVALMEYLIKTYTNKDDMVLDFALGSGSAGVAAKRLGRSFTGIELDEDYFNIAKERIESTKALDASE